MCYSMNYLKSTAVLKASVILWLCMPLSVCVYQSHKAKLPPLSPATPARLGSRHPVADGHVSGILERVRRAVEGPHTENSSSVSNSSYKIVCYYTNYAWYRNGIGKYSPRDIDPQLCTHIIYGFTRLDPDQLFIKPSDKWADIDSRLYEKVTSLKSKGVKVLVALGGWDDSAGDKYSRLVNSPTRRRRFIEHLLQFLYQHGFNGLELDWEFPKCWQLDCTKGPDSDRDAFAALVRELRRAFKPLGLLLSATIPPTRQPIDAAYNIPVMTENLDWLSVKSYDYHGHWDKRTGPSAPLYAQPDDDDYTFSVNYTVSYLTSQGADPHKLVVGMPMFGNSFKLNNPDDNGLYAYSSGPGERGEQSNVPGILAYYEICDRIRNRGWQVVQDPGGTMGPYAWHRDQWVAFDDPAMVRRKAEYIKENNLGGATVFTLDYDDFRNHCGGGKYPLLRALNTVLRQNPETDLDSSEKQTEQPPTIRPTTERQTTVGSTTERQTTVRSTTERQTTEQQTTEQQIVVHQTSEHSVKTTTEIVPTMKKIVCYFTNWSWYRQGLGKFLPQNIDTNLCTHIVYAFVSLDPKTLMVQSKDKWTDLDNDFFRQVTRLKEKGPRVLLALGGWGDSQGDKYSRLVNDPAARAQFIQHLSEFLRRYNFDGVNLHWEYPTCWQLDCNAGPASDKEGFAALVTELSRELKPRGMLMSAIVSRSNQVLEKAYDVRTLSEHLDWLELKAYDYRGSWDRRTGHGSPLYYAEGDISPYMNVNSSVHFWLDAGAPSEKLVLGIPMYGQTFTLDDPSRFSLGSPSRGPGNAGPYTSSPGTMAFFEICEMVHGEGWKVEKPPVGTMAYHDNQWVSYDDISDIERKTQYIKDLNLGGAMIWSLDNDDFNNNCGCGSYPLLRALNRGLRSGGVEVSSVANNCSTTESS